ncbi:hypothetical protein LF1_15770 [Rubripirellula obstinata]|uniref:Uncharacterized protein n=1 Tax=Rubripirellula obstinata TaxID=406547 RepID=A0A5B1CFR9_9BACT|nr:hypothetical protein LF1_15770 [Rubripirellula obstinata]
MVAVSDNDQRAFLLATRRDCQRQGGRSTGVSIGDPFADRIDPQPRASQSGSGQQSVNRFAAGRKRLFLSAVIRRCRDAVNSATQLLQQLFVLRCRRFGGCRFPWLGLCFDRLRLCPKLRCRSFRHHGFCYRSCYRCCCCCSCRCCSCPYRGKKPKCLLNGH